jgi:hypothetical protein
MIRHVFLWRLKDSREEASVLALLDELPEKVPGIRSWSTGGHVGEPGDSGEPWHGALVADFDSFDSLHDYESHPFHVQVVEELLPRFAERAVVDFPMGGQL